MTRTELLTELQRLTPAQRRTAREAGDDRPAEVIVAHLVQPPTRTVLRSA